MRGHECTPGWTTGVVLAGLKPGTMTHLPPVSAELPPGEVWACACGRTWVVKPRAMDYPDIVTFRREGWLERLRRERRR